MKKCTVAGCTGTVMCKGLCSKHYYRNKRGGDITQKSKKEKSLAERFWEKVKTSTEENCWEWQGNKNKQGYGTFRNGKMDKAHRISWVLHYGNNIGPLYVCHKCDNPSCVNPYHLFLGTNFENMRDMVEKGRLKQRNNVKLTEEQVSEIRSYKGNCTHKQLGEKYGVSKSAITAIKNNRNWKT